MILWQQGVILVYVSVWLFGVGSGMILGVVGFLLFVVSESGYSFGYSFVWLFQLGFSGFVSLYIFSLVGGGMFFSYFLVSFFYVLLFFVGIL